jgi:2-polyprenyl-3-methyl-5-hydroxy-6-metoxy-1,4-benzoquinol methylase
VSVAVRQQGPNRPPDYHDHARDELTRLLRRPVGALLDVGCGSGRAGSALRRAGATRVVGVEVDPAAAEEARKRYDEVLAGDAEEALSGIRERFDTLLCYDILEHLARPAKVLLQLRSLTRPDGQLHVSVPNARHASLLRDLVFGGTFGYAASGHRDVTHLRWFTRSDMERLLAGTGWRVERVTATVVGRSRALDVWTRGLLHDFLALQWQFLAAPSDAIHEPDALGSLL